MSEQNSYDIQLRPEADIQSDNVAAETPVSDTVEQAADTNSLEPAKTKEKLFWFKKIRIFKFRMNQKKLFLKKNL